MAKIYLARHYLFRCFSYKAWKGFTVLIIFFGLFVCSANGQGVLRGRVNDAKTLTPLEGVTVTLLSSDNSVMTDGLGNFIFRKLQQRALDSVNFSSIGYETRTIAVSAFMNSYIAIRLTAQQVELSAVRVSSQSGEHYRTISKSDIAMRGVANSQEILRIIPGIVIGQHQGGGKAEQIFLRGFDADHGTDFRMDVDGLPINMVSHAHGQGFADGHFIIPETIDNVDFKKGPYTASKGDFATTGFVDFNTKNVLKENIIRLEAGQFNTFRLVTMFNLLNKKAARKEQFWYLATEYRYSDAYFDHPQFFNRFNLFTKYSGKISKKSHLNLSATTFWSKWNASGQIPDRAVDKGIINFFGAIDPFEGGITYRTNANIQLLTALANGGLIKNQVFYSNSHFDLHTNFTFFLEDSINGDEIRQRESRNLYGYNGSFSHPFYIGNKRVSSETGLQIRGDMTGNSELSHTKDRFTILDRLKLGNISQLSMSPYVSETLRFDEHFSINAGLRLDQFFYKYENKFGGDTTLPGAGIYKATANIISPKLNFYYHRNSNLQVYFTTGKGYHSNDARSAVVQNGILNLPSVYSADLGTVFKPVKNVIINAAVWYIYLQQEFVYSGDGGFVEFSGKTKRLGFDFSGRYEPVKSLYFDLDVNYAHGRAVGEPKGANYIPLAPIWTSSAGVTYATKRGLNGSFRYRLVGDRSANEDYSLTAKGYFITDAVINYTKPKYEIGLVVNNVFNSRWKETQFQTESRLKNEATSVDEICFTPGTPFAAKLSFTFKF